MLNVGLCRKAIGDGGASTSEDAGEGTVDAVGAVAAGLYSCMYVPVAVRLCAAELCAELCVL